jgi:hypothetical protein
LICTRLWIVDRYTVAVADKEERRRRRRGSFNVGRCMGALMRFHACTHTFHKLSYIHTGIGGGAILNTTAVAMVVVRRRRWW